MVKNPARAPEVMNHKVAELIAQMTLAEKLGQMNQVDASETHAPEHLGDLLRTGRLGSVLNVVDPKLVNELQRIAVEESRLGIPLLVGRDVIHGFRTILPIPLGQAATWNPGLVEKSARLAASEAANCGINWTFAPMVDISRDPRWGRIAESLGEDPFLTGQIAAAMVQGFQTDDLSGAGTLAACAKHFAGYGAAESGRDYATTNIPENELRNQYLKPFEATIAAGVRTIMTSFSDLNGIPATANEFLLRQVLRTEWSFDGFVVSDFDSVRQLSVHGYTENDRDSACRAVLAGVDMEMAGDTYSSHLEDLVKQGSLDMADIDAAVANILRVKFELGLFDSYLVEHKPVKAKPADEVLQLCRQAALESVVLLQNNDRVLPLNAEKLKSIAVIGPLADAPYEQLGTWVFDGDPGLSVTGLSGIKRLLQDTVDVHYVKAMETSRSPETSDFYNAVIAAERSDATVLFLGEESILSGEAHSRADINLPGAQAELARQVRAAGKPLVAVIMAGRPLTLSNIIDQVDAILYAWHPGTMGGAAIADLLFGIESPSGKLPVTFPRMVGQVPIYYNQKNTGKPPSAEAFLHIDDIDPFSPQTSLGMASFHLDAGFTPLFPFGHGLTYTEFGYDNIRVSHEKIKAGDTLTISADLTNLGKLGAVEVVQLYIRDLVGNVTRPVRELKGFRRVHVKPGSTVTVEFTLHTGELAFYGANNQLILEPGQFHVWIGGSSETGLRAGFQLTH